MNASFLTGLPPKTMQLYRQNNTPLVGGIISTNLPMRTHYKGCKVPPYPIESSLAGITSGEPASASASLPTYWLLVNNMKRQHKWRKVYMNDV